MIKDTKTKRKLIGTGVLIIILITTALSGCIGGGNWRTSKLIQTGSSTVLPLAIRWAEDFYLTDISVSGGGSSHGFNALLLGECDLADASRVLKGKDYERVGGNGDHVHENGTASAEAPSGIWPHKWIVAYDVLAVMVNKKNDWATQLNYSQLYKIFTDDDPVVYWDDVPGLDNAPHKKIEIYAPDEASGTYDFFFEEIIPNWGKEDQKASSRLDSGDGVYHPSADDNVILNALRDNKFAIGYFGLAYYLENPNLAKAVWIAEEGENFQEPSQTNVVNYPLARPLQIYTDGIPPEGDLRNEYLQFVLSEDGQEIVLEVGYVKLALVDEDLVTGQLAKL